MADLTVFPIPQIPNGYNKLGKKIMIHDLTQPESTSTKLINFEDIISTSLTYAELTNLITNNLLIEGGFYLLTDFVTIYDQPDYDVNGNPKSSVVTKTAPNIEQIWILALSSNQIADRAYSKTYPLDEIKYDWTYNVTEINGSPAKGRITERVDEWNNRTDYDHRTILFKRYDNGSGVFNQYKDNGNPSQEFLTFGNNYGVGTIIYSNYIGDYYKYAPLLGFNFLLSNNVFDINSYMTSNKTSELFYNNTFADEVINNTFGLDFSKNIFGGSTNDNSFSYDSNNNIVGVGFRGNTFKGEMGGCVVGNYFERNIIHGLFNATIGDSFNNNNNCLVANSNIGNGFQGNSLSVMSSNIGNDILLNSGEIKNFNWATSVADFDGIAKTKFNNIDGAGWLNYITSINHPEFYTSYNKEVIRDSNFSYYSKYFNGTNEVFTIID